jgi:hypothetical protein
VSQVESETGRCILLREVMGFRGHGSQKAFAEHLGISEDRWGNFERGHPLSKEVAILLVQKCPGVTLDWLLLGKVEGLTLRMARALGVLEGYPKAGARSTGVGRLA